MDCENKDRPRFSVIVPSYNCEKSIKKCLDSICGQIYQNFEIIIVDDGSKDNSLSAIYSYISYNKCDIKVIKQPNSGAGAARNTGIKNAIGQYLVFVDSDDYLDNDFLQRANKLIETTNADLVFVDIIREDVCGKILRMEKMSTYSKISKDLFLKLQLTGKIPWGGVRKIVRTSIVKQNNIEYATIHVGEECIYSFRILELSSVISFLENTYYHYVVSPNSLTAHDRPENTVQVFSNILEYFENSNKMAVYQNTIKAMAVTSVVIIVNVLAQQKKIFEALIESRVYYRRYKKYIAGPIDVESLDNRVKFCLPFLKIGIVFPIILAAYLKKFVR